MPEFKPLKYREVITILRSLGFTQSVSRSTSHQTWTCVRNGQSYAVTVAFHGTNAEYKRGTLSSIIRQSGFSKRDFYSALNPKRKQK